jgi:hypothetical protein
MPFDPKQYKEELHKKIQERFTLKEVEPAEISQDDLGLNDQPQQPSTQPQQVGTQSQPQPTGKAKDPEISMEVLRGTVQWALGEKEAGKSADEVLNQLKAMKKPGLIDFIHSYLEGSGQQAPTASPETQKTTGEPGADDLSGLTNPEEPPQPENTNQETPASQEPSGSDNLDLGL